MNAFHKVIGGFLIVIVILYLLSGTIPVRAQDSVSVQLLSGQIETSDIRIYPVSELMEGQTFQAYARGTSGNFDPFLGVTDHPVTAGTLRDHFLNVVQQVIDEGGDPVEVMPGIADEMFLVWNDDGGAGYDAALEFDVPAEGDYWLVLSSSPFRSSFGDFELTVGINAPAVLTGEAEPTGASIANLDTVASELAKSVQEVSGLLTSETPAIKYLLTSERPAMTYLLKGPDSGATLYIFAEGLTEGLHPLLELRDAGGKLLRTANLSGQSTRATLQYTYMPGESGVNNELKVYSSGEVTEGDFRLLLGANAPEVLSGEAEPVGDEIVKQPIMVQAAIQLDQITDVDQKAETFGAVANLLLYWQDPALAFDPASCDCKQLVLTYDEFIKMVTDNGITWPVFQIHNQQGNRWTQGQYIVIQPDGSTLYYERFWTTLQAPDFDFRKYPFDQQHFFIQLDLLNSEEFFVYTDLDEQTTVGTQLGEEQWFITDYYTTVGTQRFGSSFTFSFIASRHLDYYVLRVFVPLGLIIIVSWVTFFLKDYTKRIEVAGANFLVFVAFNFTISDSLPKLGYTTFLDGIIMVIFIITAAVIVLNVVFKRMELGGHGERVKRIDSILVWVYLLVYVLIVTLLALLYLL